MITILWVVPIGKVWGIVAGSLFCFGIVIQWFWKKLD